MSQHGSPIIWPGTPQALQFGDGNIYQGLRISFLVLLVLQLGRSQSLVGSQMVLMESLGLVDLL